ncbi:hypothetical protein [Anaerovibrio lipolyticus]|uniref:hypothetical protein n=1 Tax=Anaerovibrio lipolyticus TaxID=82374 RepID=UPI0004818F0A|nr:hypothetical protein [Anaerovibrio lipolyticus]
MKDYPYCNNKLWAAAFARNLKMMRLIELRKVYVLFLLFIVLLSSSGCETKADIEAREQEQQYSFINRSIEGYQKGIAIFHEMDFAHPDQQKAKEASTAFFGGTPDHVRMSERTDCASTIADVCPNAEALYYTANCLEIIAEWGGIEKGITVKNSMLLYYAGLIPENYSGPLKKKVLTLRSQIFDINENVVKPKKAAQEVRHKQLQAEYNRTYSERVAKMSGNDPYYDEEYYTAGNYREEYDDDGYRVDRQEAREHHRQSGGGTRRWR